MPHLRLWNAFVYTCGPRVSARADTIGNICRLSPHVDASNVIYLSRTRCHCKIISAKGTQSLVTLGVCVCVGVFGMAMSTSRTIYPNH